jgi:hypothetical protein
MNILTVFIEGKLQEISEPYEYKGQKVQKVVIECNYNDTRIKNDYFAVMIYGEKAITEFWQDYNDNDKPTAVSIVARLNGRVTNNRHSLMLSYMKVQWIY